MDGVILDVNNNLFKVFFRVDQFSFKRAFEQCTTYTEAFVKCFDDFKPDRFKKPVRFKIVNKGSQGIIS